MKMISSERFLLSDADLAAAAQALGLMHCDAGLTTALNDACQSYVNEAATRVRLPRAKITELLDDILETAERLNRLLMRCHETSDEDSLADEVAFLLISAGGQKKIRPLIEELEQIDEIVRRAIKMVPSTKAGRPSHVPVHALVAKLKAIFELATGTSAGVTWNAYGANGAQYTGQFFDLVSIIERALAKHLGKQPQSNWALGDLLRRVKKGEPRRRGRASQGA